MRENEQDFNERLAKMIRSYWRERGQIARVWTALTSPPSPSGPTPHQICSNMTNGYPPNAVERERTHV